MARGNRVWRSLAAFSQSSLRCLSERPGGLSPSRRSRQPKKASKTLVGTLGDFDRRSSPLFAGGRTRCYRRKEGRWY